MENHPPAPPASEMDDQKVLDNIDGRMHGPMNGFIKKFFGNFQYVHQETSLVIQVAGGVSHRCAVPSAAPSPDDFLRWLSEYVSQEHDGARGSWIIPSGDVAPEHESADGGARLLLTIPTSPASNVQIRWEHVQVVGQFYHHGCVSYQDGLFTDRALGLDRSGLYCSDVFDVQKDFIQFLRIILSYERMTDQDLGNNNIIETDEGGSYIILDSAAMPSLGKIYLESQPIASRQGVVGSGTTCYRARKPDSDRWDYVLKLKWRWARQRPEDELLRLAKEKDIWDAVSLDYYQELENTPNLRRGLRWGTHRKFVRVHSNERHASVDEQQQDASCSASGLVDYTEETDNFFQNRILACIVTSPVGRPLHTFRSVTELLQVFHDAIECHRSFYNGAQILHRDISPGNMVILDGQDEEKPKGILIDLDSAIELDEAAGTKHGITGTRPFMAIGVLKGENHTYRHDLESFLYVFLWTIITNHRENPPATSKLRQWSNDDWSDLASRKSLDMDPDNFQNILEEFTSEFHSLRPIAESLRQVLFPLRDGVIWTGSDGSPEDVDKLYDGMIRAFEEAIEAIGSEDGR